MKVDFGIRVEEFERYIDYALQRISDGNFLSIKVKTYDVWRGRFIPVVFWCLLSFWHGFYEKRARLPISDQYYYWEKFASVILSYHPGTCLSNKITYFNFYGSTCMQLVVVHRALRQSGARLNLFESSQVSTTSVRLTGRRAYIDWWPWAELRRRMDGDQARDNSDPSTCPEICIKGRQQIPRYLYLEILRISSVCIETSKLLYNLWLPFA